MLALVLCLWAVDWDAVAVCRGRTLLGLGVAMRSRSRSVIDGSLKEPTRRLRRGWEHPDKEKDKKPDDRDRRAWQAGGGHHPSPSLL